MITEKIRFLAVVAFIGLAGSWPVLGQAVSPTAEDDLAFLEALPPTSASVGSCLFGLRMPGTWLFRILFDPGQGMPEDASSFDLATLYSGGGLVVTGAAGAIAFPVVDGQGNVEMKNGIVSTGHGSWQMVKSTTFALSSWRYVRGEQGELYGLIWVSATGEVTRNTGSGTYLLRFVFPDLQPVPGVAITGPFTMKRVLQGEQLSFD